MRAFFLSLACGSALLAAGCGDSSDTDLQDNIDQTGFYARFSPSDSIIPFPNNVLFSGSTDGTLNIPTPDGASDGQKATIAAMNNLNGFSTVAPFSTTFSKAVDPSTLTPGQTVRVFQVTLSGIAGAVVSISAELEGLAADKHNFATAQYAVSLSSLDTSNKTLVISPIKPLAAKTSYLVALSTGIKDTGGGNVAADLIYAFTKSQSPLIAANPTSLDDINFTALKAVEDYDKDGDVDADDVTTHLAVITNLDKLRVATNFAETQIQEFTVDDDTTDAVNDLTSSDIILSWSFTTQSMADVLTQVRADLAAGVVPASSFEAGPVDLSAAGVGSAADFYKGRVEVNYYLDADQPLAGFWQGITLVLGDASPDVQSQQTIPVLVSVPKGTKPAGGWPTVIFQHGITGNRSNLLGAADTLASAGFAAVAIDMPLHGLVQGNTLKPLLAVTGVAERTFELDLHTYDSQGNRTADAPDGIEDPSGQYFINLTSLLTSRDNVRQAVADLFSLRFALATMDYDSDGNGGGPDFDTTQLQFLGHSLGAIVGGVFCALEPDVHTVVLGMPGGGIAKLLDGSAAFGPVIASGLAGNGVIKGSSDYESFMASAQMVIDSADPINYTNALAASDKGVLLFEIVGDGTSAHPSDLVVPNTVPDANDDGTTLPAPLSGTDPLAALLGLQKTSIDLDGSGDALKAEVQFTQGHHGSLLSPNGASGAADPSAFSVYVEMAQEMASFFASSGTLLNLDDSDSNNIIKDQ